MATVGHRSGFPDGMKRTGGFTSFATKKKSFWYFPDEKYKVWFFDQTKNCSQYVVLSGGAKILV